MKRRPRIYRSDSQKALMGARWKQGWTLNETSAGRTGVRTGLAGSAKSWIANVSFADRTIGSTSSRLRRSILWVHASNCALG